MKRLFEIAVVIAVFAVGGPLLWAADKEKPPVVYWRHTWEAGLAEAQMRNVPIFITFHKDG